ncbi:hypothetical protein Q5752_006002 [Cryptotrichosporon argae]
MEQDAFMPNVQLLIVPYHDNVYQWHLHRVPLAHYMQYAVHLDSLSIRIPPDQPGYTFMRDTHKAQPFKRVCVHGHANGGRFQTTTTEDLFVVNFRRHPAAPFGGVHARQRRSGELAQRLADKNDEAVLEIIKAKVHRTAPSLIGNDVTLSPDALNAIE